MVGHKRVSVIYVVAVAMNAVDLIKFCRRTDKKKEEEDEERRKKDILLWSVIFHAIPGWLLIMYMASIKRT